MKVKILGDSETVKRIKEELLRENVSIVDLDEDFLIIPSKQNKKPIIGKIGEDIFVLRPEQIIYFESEGNDSICITKDNTYYVKEKLYQLEALLNEDKFLRVSRFHIVNMRQIKSIRSSQNMKFDLKMNNGDIVTVTRSYYYIFKEYLGI